MVPDLATHLASPMLVAGRLAFLSDHEGTANIYSVDLDGGDLRRHTDHDGPYARQASTDGARIVYMCRGDLWLLDSLEAPASRQLDLSLPSAISGRAPRLITAADHVGGLSCDETGQASAVEVRGTIHWLTHRDGPARALSVTPGVRARMPRVLGKDGLVVWVTDADGRHGLEIGGDDDGKPVPPRRLAAGEIGMVSSLAASPDGRTVAVAAGDGRLRLVDVASGAVSELAHSEDGEVSGLAWSGDSAWLAWSEPRLSPLRLIRVASVGDREVHDVTDGRFIDTDPAFTADGKFLAFLSKRSFDPIYDAHFFDLSFPLGSRPYLLPLAASTPSPFAPQSGGRRIGDGPAARDAGKESEAGQEGQEAKADGGDGGLPPKVTIDFDGIAPRVVAVPVPESRYASLRAVKGGLAWLQEPLTGNLGQGGARLTDDAPRACLERFDLQRQRATTLADDVDWFAVSGDGTRLVVSDQGKLTVLPADRKADPDNPDDHVSVDGSRARFLADPVELWRHAYDEAGRIMAARLLDTGHGRRRLGGGACRVPSAGRPHDQRQRFRRPDLGDVRRARRLARLRHPGGGGARQRLGRQYSRPARRGYRARCGRQLAHRPGHPGRVVRSAGTLAARGPRRARSRGGAAGGRGRPAGGGGRPLAAAGGHPRQAGGAHDREHIRWRCSAGSW